MAVLVNGPPPFYTLPGTLPDHALGPDAGPSSPRSFYGSHLHQSLEHALLLVALCSCQQDGYGLTGTFGVQVDLAREPASTSS